MKKLMILLIFGMFGMATAKNYSIDSTNYTTRNNLIVSERLAILPEFGNQIFPSMPSTIELGSLYLRNKEDAQSYSWFKSKPRSQAYHKLHAFRDATIDINEFVYTKFYGSINAKAFQDEAEVYFDENYIYSSRVSTLYYMRDGRWHELKSQDAELGTLIVETSFPCSVAINGRQMGLTPLHLSGVMAGVHGINLWAPGYIDLITGAVVVHAKQTTKVVEMIPLDSVSEYAPLHQVSMENVTQAVLLEQLEPWWDQLENNNELYLQFVEQKKSDFHAIYPPVLKPPPFIALGDLDYKRYIERFEQTRAQAQEQFLEVTVGSNQEQAAIWEIANARKDSLEADTLVQRVMLDVWRVESDILYLKLSDQKQRMDFTWSTRMNAEIYSDSLLALLQDSTAETYLQVKYQNKPAMLVDSLQQRYRKNYRYLDMFLIVENEVDTLEGVFLLPNYLLALQEVQDWLAAQTPKTLPEVVDTVEPEIAVQDVIPPPPEPEEPEVPIDPNFWVQHYRGIVVEIPGGTFRYKGKTVQMSPFALHRTEVSQEHLQRITLKNPAKKFVGAKLPAHSINWHDARAFCREIGGDLPTEAQWEYAARAASESGLEWEQFKGEGISADDFVVYANDPKNKDSGPQVVASKRPNAWGLYDMTGNVSEWTLDKDSWFNFYVQSQDPTGSWIGADRVLKGASWQSSADKLDLKNKDYEDPRYWSPKLGFRCVFPAEQALNPENFKKELLAKDSLVMSQGLQLLGGNIEQLIQEASQ
ncbi:MAG: SUMF1/EgtB/PvdO family nonheme iron enzyme [Fibrobacter sp.]|nr:SUMF1/EgtB/PvdO family nonheme iron enzyme [Fibrobacter sp.]